MDSIKLVKIKTREIFKAWLLQRKGFRETLEKYQDYKTSPATESIIEFYSKFMNKAADNYWVLCNGEIAGALCVVSRPDCLWIGRFYILPKFRNKGIGQQALRMAENLYPAVKRWQLDTIFEEKNNIHLYEKLGYKEYGERRKINERMTIVNYEKEVQMDRKREIEILNAYYNKHDEDSRLSPKSNSVEFLTTMKYIKKYLNKDMKILEIGAGTGRYSLALADEGYSVDAVDLVQHNIDVFKSKMKPNYNVTITQGDACNLDFVKDNTYDITLLLGPMYHLFNEEDKLKALSEAIRVTKTGGVVFVAYIGSNISIYHLFNSNSIAEYKAKHYIDDEFNRIPVPENLFMHYRKENIDNLMKNFSVKRLHYVGTDMLHRYMMHVINDMDEQTFEDYITFHYKMCEKEDCVGLSNHLLDVFRKK